MSKTRRPMAEMLALDKEVETEMQMLSGVAHAAIAKVVVLGWKAGKTPK